MPAPTVSRNPVVQEHYAAQLALSAALQQATLRMAGGPADHLDAVALLTHQYGLAAVSLARDYYLDLRDQAGVSGSFRPPVVAPMPVDNMAAYFESALADLTSELDQQVADFAARLALNSGTDELFASIEADRQRGTRVRWARVTRPGACSFCLMLATRGAVYRTESSANFRPHKGCHCDVEPTFGPYEPPAHIRAAQVLWSESTDDVKGSRAKQNAFRRALDAERRTSR